MIPKEILKKVRQIEIVTSRMVNDVMAGEYHSVFKGRGMEFDAVREYVQGDDARDIDWNVTARAGFPHIKRYVEERELTVMLVVDASASGEFGSTGQMKGEVAVEISAVLAFAAIKNNDRVGLIIFTDDVEVFIPPKKGRKHVLRVIRELLYFKPKHRGTNVAAALDYLNRVTTRKAVVFLISDFIDEGLKQPLSIANRRHDLIALTIADPRERELAPVGFLEFEDAETGELVVVDTSSTETRRLFSQQATDESDELDTLFRSLNIDRIAIQTDRPYSESLARFFRERAKRY